MASTWRKPFGWFAAANLVVVAFPLGCSDGVVPDDRNEASAGHVGAGVGGSGGSSGGSNGASQAVAGKNALGSAAGRTATFASGGLGQGGARGGQGGAAAAGRSGGEGGSPGGHDGAGAAGGPVSAGTGGLQTAGAGQVGIAGAASGGAPSGEPPVGGAPGSGAGSGGRGGTSSGGRGGAAGLGGSAGMAIITLPFKEDFEDGNTTGWNLQYVNAYTSSLQPGTGASGTSRSLLLTKTQDTGYCCDGFSRQFATGLTPSRVSFWLRSDATDTDAGYVRLSASTDATQWLAYVSFFQNNLNLSAAQSYVHAFTPGRFCHVEFRAISWTQRTFQYWVDGTQIAASVGMKDAAASSLKRIDLYGRTPNKSAFIDEIELSP